jgi:hypothetical protein
MADFFHAYFAERAKIPTFFIESTAPNDVDDRPAPPVTSPGLTPIDPDKAIEDIASHLSCAAQPNLVVMIHGFNNSHKAVLAAYAEAFRAIESDPAICNHAGLVCVGYRWPSERMGAPWRATLAALPSFPSWLLWCGLLLFAGYPIWILSMAFHAWPLTAAGHLLALLGWTLIGAIAGAALLRATVYFRDSYRAANYGAPDLIEIIRQIDRQIIEHDLRTAGSSGTKLRSDQNRVQLSFIGHSMGGFVVTNAIRALSDLFARDALRPHLNAGTVNEHSGWSLATVSPNVGNALQLMRFVLASPDISAETLLSNRANYLASSLRRFREAYLFSNEGDEVLRQISTTANYFSFPTKSWKHGYRLGNVEILSKDYGVIELGKATLLQALRIGYYTLQELYEGLRSARKEVAEVSGSIQALLPEVFSYFDCTDYIDSTNVAAQPRGLLTFALNKKKSGAKRRMSGWDHISLLWSYVFHQNPNVHGGYFEGNLCRQIIYRLACLGFDDTVNAYDGLVAFSSECKDKQIKVLLSPILVAKSRHTASHASHPRSTSLADLRSVETHEAQARTPIARA